MEPFSVSASAVALLQTASMTLKYIYDIKHASRERSELAREVTSLLSVLQKLNDRLENTSEDAPWFQTSKLLASPGGPLAQLDEALQDIQAKLFPESRLRKLSHKLTWPGARLDLDRRLSQVERLKSQIDMVVREDNLQISQQVLNLSKTTSETLQSIESTELLQNVAAWISPLNFQAHQQFILHQATASTGKWLLQSKKFISWTTGSPFVLYCPGMPGAGKTVMSSIVIKHLQENFSEQNIPVLFLYLNHREIGDQTLQNLVGSLIRQLIQRNIHSDLPDELKVLWNSSKGVNAKPSLEQLVSILRVQLKEFKNCFIIVDALDECLDETIRDGLTDILKRLQEFGSRIFITSRPHFSRDIIICDICDQQDLSRYYHCFICDNSDFDLCEKCCEGGQTCLDDSHVLYELRATKILQIKASGTDLNNYVEQRIATETRILAICRKDPEMRLKITEKVIEAADGMFLFAKLLIDSLKTKLTPKAMNKALDSMPTTLNGLYDDVMDRIERQGEDDAVLAKDILKWVVWAKRTLSVEELLHVLAVSPGDKEIDVTEILDETLLSMVTGGLIIKDFQNMIRLVHYTAYNYFKENQERLIPNAGLEITRTVLTYLNFHEFAEPCQDTDWLLDERLRKYPFLRYASAYWGNHVCEYYNHQIDTRKATLELVRDTKRVASSLQAGWPSARSWNALKLGSGLHLCAYFGLDETINDLVSDGSFIDIQATPQSSTPLMQACSSGHLRTVKTLLRLGASVNIRTTRGGTALSQAIISNRTDVVALLLKEKHLDVNSRQKHLGQTGLIMAVTKECYDVMILLLERSDIQIDISDTFGWSASHYAATASEPKYIKALASHPSFDPDVVTTIAPYATPLILAAKSGIVKNVEMLLKLNANPEFCDADGRVAIRWAIDCGHISTVRELLRHNVNVHVLDRKSRTLLHGSCVSNCIDIAELLLSTGLNVNACGDGGETCLHDAAKFSFCDMGVLLLRNGADPSIVDNHGRTVLAKALQHGNFEFAQMLSNEQGHPKTLADATENDLEKLPLWILARLGLTEEVEKYISRGGKPDTKDPDTFDSALHAAVLSANLIIMEILLKAGMDPNSLNASNYTALHFCSFTGDKAASQLLLQYGAGLNDTALNGKTALQIACESEHFDVAVLLVESGATMQSISNYIVQVLFAAIEMGSVEAVERLVAESIDSDAHVSKGATPIMLAKSLGHEKIIQVLKQRETLPLRNKFES